MNYNLIISVLVLVLLGAGFLLLQPAQNVGQATPGLPTSIASSSTVVIGPGGYETLFPRSETCTTRVVTTGGTAMRVSFGEISLSDDWGVASTTLSETIGHFQATDTTAVYDAGLYGCGLFTAFGSIASSTITISEFR